MGPAVISYVHGGITIAESIFNVIGYLPTNLCPRVKEAAFKGRLTMGIAQTIIGLSIATFGFLFELFTKKSAQPHKYLSMGQKAVGFGLAHTNHGLLNVIRAFIEKQGLGLITFAYDFYGRKFLPSLSPKCNFPSIAFEWVKQGLDRVHFVTLLPPKILLRSPH